jgi:hypothetical protein
MAQDFFSCRINGGKVLLSRDKGAIDEVAILRFDGDD